MTEPVKLTDLEFESLFASATEGYAVGENEIHDPLTGTLYAVTDADRLIDSYEFAKEVADAVFAWQRHLRQRIAALTSGTAKTRRVKGQKRLAKVTMPDDSWDNSILKEAWNAYPDLRDGLLRIGKVDVKMREFKKAANTAGPDAYNNFVKMIASAQREPTALPTVTIEE